MRRGKVQTAQTVVAALRGLLDIIGVVGEVITPIPEKGVGEIAYVQKGARYSAPAREQSGAPVPGGAAVKIVRVAGSQFYVAAV